MDSVLPAPRTVDRDTFDRIECNRCGQCCTALWMNGGINYRGPLGLLEWVGQYDVGTRSRRPARRYTPSFDPLDMTAWIGQLIPLPLTGTDGVYRYRCGYYDDEKGCTIYALRPNLCREYPYGAPTQDHDRCAWNVEILEYEHVSGVLLV